MGVLMPLGIVAIMLLISGPSMVIAWLKLRQRNLGPILDANGWAVNTRAKINIPFGGTLTSVAKLPPGSSRDLRDPYAESKQGRIWTITIAALLAIVWALWYFGILEDWVARTPVCPRAAGRNGARLPELSRLRNPSRPRM